MELTEQQELFLVYLEQYGTISKASKATGINPHTGSAWAKKFKDVIIDRAREKLAVGALKAANTTVELMDADAATEKGELKLKAAESVMDRVGLTKHTSVEVSVESENGLFILPAKGALSPEEDS